MKVNLSHILRKFMLVSGIFLLLVVLVIAAWATYQHLRDPLAALDRGSPDLRVVRQHAYPVALEDENRTYIDFTLSAEGLDSLRITVSLPAHPVPDGIPSLVILGGLEIGRESLQYVPAHGSNALIAYEYPYSPRYWYDGTPLTQVPVIRQSVLKVPAQVEAVLRWALQQPWSDHQRISLLGYSFGAMFVPAVNHLAASHQSPPAATVIAYGGADIFRLLKANFKFLPPLPRYAVAWLASTAIQPVEPEAHLPHMQGTFLVINGKQDHQIPQNCWKKLQSLTPEPKTVMVLDAGHMNPAKPDLTRKLVTISRQWLLDLNAINP
ncbi:MAG: dienelactone hydrolase family protein [Calditrichia bacterium]